MLKVVKIAALAALMAAVGGSAYAVPVDFSFTSSTTGGLGSDANGWKTNAVDTHSPNGPGASVVFVAPAVFPSDQDPENFGDPSLWRSPFSPGVSGAGNFAYLRAGICTTVNTADCPGDGGHYTTLTSDAFTVKAGDVLKLYSFFDSQDLYDPAFNDDGYVKVITSASLTVNPISGLTSGVTFGPTFLPTNFTAGNSNHPECDYGSDDSYWTYLGTPAGNPGRNAGTPIECINNPTVGPTPLVYTFLSAGTYRIIAGVSNQDVNDNTFPAALGLDGVFTSAPQVPEPGTLMLLGSGLALGLAHYRRQRTPRA